MTGDIKLWAFYVSVVAFGAKIVAFAVQYVAFPDSHHQPDFARPAPDQTRFRRKTRQDKKAADDFRPIGLAFRDALYRRLSLNHSRFAKKKNEEI